jgi:hypothetical protein
MSAPRLRWSLYEDEPLDTDSLLGQFFLIWRRVEVGTHDTYVDTWLASLSELVEQLRGKARAEVEVLEEAIRIKATRRAGVLKLHFNDVALPAMPFGTFEQLLRTEARRFRRHVRARAKGPVTEALETIERFGRSGLARVPHRP